MESNHVIYQATLNGEEVAITLEQILQNDTVADRVLHAGCKRVIDTAAQSHESEDDKAAAKLARAQDILSGNPWPTGGGNRLSDTEYHRRDVLAGYAQSALAVSRSKALDAIRKDEKSILEQTAAAIVQKREGKKPGRDRLAKAVDAFKARIAEDVKARLAQDDIAI